MRTIWRLRQPDGCPWDREQTHASLSAHLVEEAYEAVEAIADGDVAHLREELGDVLEQVLLHAQVAADEGAFTVDDVCHDLNEKLVRRHPHVFGARAQDMTATSADAVLDIWDDVKRQEREAKGASDDGETSGLLDSIPVSLPALLQCQKISKRAAAAGFEWEDVRAVWSQVQSERREFEAEAPGSEAAAEEFGDLLFALVNVARHEGIDAEGALARSNRKFRRRWAFMERQARERQVCLDELSVRELNQLWDEAKRQERGA
ncbi:nucleoside triphosphate pyrophosphohydrolase [Olsenella massiliensis]|uniref:nucleoside triphosphate pyrophosphohydrolase n=1 Tax=Olsenella massiliensis TaxID=1622075 RepID=UPI000A77DF19